MNQIELEKIADFFDKDRSGVIDLSEILRVLKGSKRGKYVQEAMTDAEKIENEVLADFAFLVHCSRMCMCFTSSDPIPSFQVYLCQEVPCNSSGRRPI